MGSGNKTQGVAATLPERRASEQTSTLTQERLGVARGFTSSKPARDLCKIRTFAALLTDAAAAPFRVGRPAHVHII